MLAAISKFAASRSFAAAPEVWHKCICERNGCNACTRWAIRWWSAFLSRSQRNSGFERSNRFHDFPRTTYGINGEIHQKRTKVMIYEDDLCNWCKRPQSDKRGIIAIVNWTKQCVKEIAQLSRSILDCLEILNRGRTNVTQNLTKPNQSQYEDGPHTRTHAYKSKDYRQRTHTPTNIKKRRHTRILPKGFYLFPVI